MTSLCSGFAVQPSYEPVKSAQVYQECYSPLGDPCRKIYIGYFMLSKSLPMAISVFLLSSLPTRLWVRFREFHFQIVIFFHKVNFEKSTIIRLSSGHFRWQSASVRVSTFFHLVALRRERRTRSSLLLKPAQDSKLSV